MIKRYFLLCGLAVSTIFLGINSAQAQEQQGVRFARGAQKRVADNKARHNLTFTDVGNEYIEYKNWLSKEYGIDFAMDVSYMAQRGAPNGEHTSYQTIASPSIVWKTFDNEYGTGTLNIAYNMVRYGGISANHLGDNIGVATPINDFPSKSNAFDELYYNYQFAGDLKWLSVAVGQFPLYNFDGTAYDSNQQVNFMNLALSQNASSTYSISGVGTFVQVAPNSEWTFILGGQDATNISGESVRVNNLDEEHYTTFAYASYTPTISGLGAAQYSVLLYNQPGVREQKETTNGWSINVMQDIGEKFSVFGRVNGVSGNVATINQSWVAGMVYKNPINRNPLDQIGFAFAYNKVDKAVAGETYNNDEKILEAYWAWGVSKWMTITPDVQFYIDPALNKKSDYDTVVSLRANFFF